MGLVRVRVRVMVKVRVKVRFRFLSLHRSVLALRARLRDASFPAIELRARGTGLYWFSKGLGY